MADNLVNSCKRELSARSRLTTAIIFSALLFAAFAPVFVLVETGGQVPAGMVYCPLSKRFQPINPLEKKKQPFDEICASRETKDFLVQEIFIKNLFRKIALEESSFDDLAFDFLAHGKAALKTLPGLPHQPSDNLAKQVQLNASFNNYEYQFIWKKLVKISSPKLAPRPPTVQEKPFFPLAPIYQSDELSRRLAPRAPPFLS